MIYCADFETVNNEDDCRVWCWAGIELYERSCNTGKDIESFMEWLCSIENNSVVYFHNLKFDGEFIVYYMLTHDYVLIKEGKKKKASNTFQTLIGDMGQWYSVTINLGNGKTVVLYDSLKIWNFSLSELAPSMGMDIGKGEIDYNAYRPVGYEPTAEEWDYVKRDVLITCKAIQVTHSRGYTKMTAGSNALWDYRSSLDKKQWKYWFPKLSESEDIFVRKSYRGGWTYTNPLFAKRVIGDGIVLDVNSLYPSRMYYMDMPYGEGVYYKGKYKGIKLYPLYVQRVIVDLTLKPKHLPTLQAKHNIRFGKTEYIRTTNGEPLELTLTCIDLDLMFEQYDVHSIEYVDGYAYKACQGMFSDYIDRWMKEKEEASKENDKPRRNLAKLFMNSLYGKFAKRPKVAVKYPEISDAGVVHLVLGDEEDTGGLYIPVGTFITSYARDYTIRSAQAVYSRFLYADTDSLHLLGTEVPDGIEVHPTKLGAWKLEDTFCRGIYLGAKCYAEEINVSRETLDRYIDEHPEASCQVDYDRLTLLQLTVAGMPAKSKRHVAFDDFREGLVVEDKLVPKHVPGGIVLKPTTFEIKTR